MENLKTNKKEKGEKQTFENRAEGSTTMVTCLLHPKNPFVWR